jgi:hypothetical protein
MNEITFPYKQIDAYSMMPIVPIRLEYGSKSLILEGLIDSGASVNVMPYQVGLELGFDWDKCVVGPAITGSVSSEETRMLVARGYIANLELIELGFMWTKSPTFRLLLGQNNFFKYFKICFSRTNLTIQLAPESA